MTIGDIMAQLSACHIGERAIHDLIDRYGPNTFQACTQELIDYTERLVRSEIASWPDASHSFTDYMDSDGVGGPPVKIHVTITISGDTLRADFTGTDPQVPGAINNTLSFTASVVALCVRAALKEDVPNTAGMFKPLEIIAPPGTVLNGVMPAASSMRGITGFRLADTMFGALAGLLPDRILAAGEGGNSLVIIGGQNADRTPYVFFELLSGKAHLAIRSDRRDHLPYGLHGGKPGRGSVNIIRREDGEEVLPETARQEYGIAVDSSSHFALAKWLGIRVYEILRTSHPFSEFLRGRTTANPCDQIPQGTTLRYRRATDRKPRNPWSP